MSDKEIFYDWWKKHGCRGISFCEINYSKLPKKILREYVKEFRKQNTTKKKQRIVQINDLHIPFHDKRTLEIFYKFLSDVRVDQLVIAGDLLDFYELSSFDKDPKRKFTIQDEIDQSYEILKEFKVHCPEIHFIKGNHENRLKKFLWKNPSLASIKVLELPSLLNLDSLGIEYHDFEYIFRNFRFTHGSIVRQDGGASAKAELLKYGSNTSSGHTHRLAIFMKTDARGTVFAGEGGCMCGLTPEYIPGTPNWQQGFLTFDFDGDRFFGQAVPILDHKFIYGSKKYK